MTDQENSLTLLCDGFAAILKSIVKEAIREALNDNKQGTRQRLSGDNTFLNVKQAAEVSGLGVSTIRLYIRKRQLRVHQVGRRVLIKREDLEKFLEANPIEMIHE